MSAKIPGEYFRGCEIFPYFLRFSLIFLSFPGEGLKIFSENLRGLKMFWSHWRGS